MLNPVDVLVTRPIVAPARDRTERARLRSSRRDCARADFASSIFGLEDVDISDQRIAIRVAQGVHDVPREKLEARFRRTLANLERAIEQLPQAPVFDNSRFEERHRQVAEIRAGKLTFVNQPMPGWFQAIAARLGRTM